jgi:hypothetical protein
MNMVLSHFCRFSKFGLYVVMISTMVITLLKVHLNGTYNPIKNDFNFTHFTGYNCCVVVGYCIWPRFPTSASKPGLC